MRRTLEFKRLSLNDWIGPYRAGVV